jgi:hypothetical protein
MADRFAQVYGPDIEPLTSFKDSEATGGRNKELLH